MDAFFTRIRVRILAIVLLAIVPAIGLIFYSAAERKRQISEEIENNALRLSRFLASNLERDLSEGQGFLHAGSKLIESGFITSGNCQTILSELLGDSSVYANLGVMGTDGQVRCSAYPLPKGTDPKALDWIQRIKAKPEFTVGFDFNGVLSHEVSINLALPISGKPGQPGQTIFAVMDLEWLNGLAKNSHLPIGSAIGVTNRKGDAVARYPDPDKWVGKPYPRAPDMDSDFADEGIKLAKGIDGIRRMYAFAKVHGKGDLVVHVGIRREAIYAPANRALRRQLFALGVVGFLAILAAWFASDMFLIKQVRALITATQKLASGNLGARSYLSYDKGELGELARAFDEMAETLEWRDAQLRESEIERSNPSTQLFDLLENAPEPILIFDGAFLVVSANQQAAKLFGYPADAIIGRPFQFLFPNAAQKLNLDETLILNVLQQMQNHHLKAEGRHKDGSIFSMEISISKTLFGKQTLIVAILRTSEKRELSR